MDDQRVGAAIKAIRQRRRWRQVDLAAKAGVSRWTVMRIERGRLAKLQLDTIRRACEPLDARAALIIRWQGGELDRLVNARHGWMHEAMARFFRTMAAWVAEPEVSFSVWGERGIIDILAWHADARALLVIELKTEIVDINELLGTFDRKRRLANQIARARGLQPVHLGNWVVLADSRTNRRAARAHASAMRAKLPATERDIAAWLRNPTSNISAFGFMPKVHGAHLRAEIAPIKRVRASTEHQSKP